MIKAVFFVAALVMGACGLLGYCCVRVGSMYDDEWDELLGGQLNDGT